MFRCIVNTTRSHAAGLPEYVDFIRKEKKSLLFNKRTSQSSLPLHGSVTTTYGSDSEMMGREGKG